MKNLISYLLFISFIGNIMAQSTGEKTKYCEDVSKHLKDHNPFNQYTETALKSSDTMADFNTQSQKLKITGTVFKSDGVTPASDVIIYIRQANQSGEYTLLASNNTNSTKHQLWVKTDSQGKYSIYTFVPGSANKPLTYPHEPLPMHIHAMIKEPGNQEYPLNAFIFDNDPLVTKTCRKRLKRKKIDSILMLKTEGELQVATKNIVLETSGNTL